jgi:histidine triad (HIT) family protein
LTVAVMNPTQFEVGQTLVVPKRHAPTLLDLTDEEAGAVMTMVRQVAAATVAALEVDGLTLYQNNGVASLQRIPHFHMHVVPRRYGSGWGEGPPHLAVVDEAERDAWLQKGTTPMDVLEPLAARIRASLA